MRANWGYYGQLENREQKIITSHFWVPLCLCFKTSPGSKPFLWKRIWFAWKWNCRWNLFSSEWFPPRTRFDMETKSNSEMGCLDPSRKPWSCAMGDTKKSLHFRLNKNVDSQRGCTYTLIQIMKHGNLCTLYKLSLFINMNLAI